MGRLQRQKTGVSSKCTLISPWTIECSRTFYQKRDKALAKEKDSGLFTGKVPDKYTKHLPGERTSLVSVGYYRSKKNGEEVIQKRNKLVKQLPTGSFYEYYSSMRQEGLPRIRKRVLPVYRKMRLGPSTKSSSPEGSRKPWRSLKHRNKPSRWTL